jgi:phage tail-like protein
MPNVSPSARLRDPLRNFQFQVLIDGLNGLATPVGGVQRVSGLSHAVTAYEVWEGGNNLHRYANPDKVTWDPISLEQGLALDDTLEQWASAVRHFAMTGQLLTPPGAASPLRLKRNVVIEARDPVFATTASHMATPKDATPLGRRYRVFNAWISKYTALPRLDATAAEVALLTVELTHEGWALEPFPAPAGAAP